MRLLQAISEVQRPAAVASEAPRSHSVGMRPWVLAAGFALCAVVLAWVLLHPFALSGPGSVLSFADCVRAGYAVAEEGRRCAAPDGRVFHAADRVTVHRPGLPFSFSYHPPVVERRGEASHAVFLAGSGTWLTLTFADSRATLDRFAAQFTTGSGSRTVLRSRIDAGHRALLVQEEPGAAGLATLVIEAAPPFSYAGRQARFAVLRGTQELVRFALRSLALDPASPGQPRQFFVLPPW